MQGMMMFTVELELELEEAINSILRLLSHGCHCNGGKLNELSTH